MPDETSFVSIAALLAASCGMPIESTTAPVPPPQRASVPAAQPSPAASVRGLAGFEDRGELRLYSNEEPIARVIYELDKSGAYRETIDLWQTGITIAEKRRLRVEVASAAFPVFSRNLDTGGHNETETRYKPATQRIHHSKKYPSHVIVPMIPAKALEQ